MYSHLYHKCIHNPKRGQCIKWFHFTWKEAITHIDFIEDVKLMYITYPFDMYKQNNK